MEMRLLVGEHVGLGVAECRRRLVLDAVIERLHDVFLEVLRARMRVHHGLDARTEPGATRIVAADDGPGVPEEFRQELLLPFRRLERSRTTPSSGLGLSLAS